MHDRLAASHAVTPGRGMLGGAFVVCLIMALSASFPVAARTPDFFRIGTGGEAGTYFPIGSLLARVVSGGEYDCQPDGGCTRFGPLVVAQVSNGSVSNVQGIADGLLEAGLVQADIAHWAYSGSQLFSGQESRGNLRAIANLYPESVHLVVGPGSGIDSVADLRGKRVSLDESGSGTLVDAIAILAAYGIDESEFDPVYLKPGFASERLSRGDIDAFFIVAGYPALSVVHALRNGARLVPIQGSQANRLVEDLPFFATGTIPTGTYPGSTETRTLVVGAQLLVGADIDADLVYAFTRILWSTDAARMLQQGHPKGREIKLKTALEGLAVPLHPGAERYYAQVVPEYLSALPVAGQ